jgi:light-harvesting complex I chlorophyll a/b binding protein 4
MQLTLATTLCLTASAFVAPAAKTQQSASRTTALASLPVESSFATMSGGFGFAENNGLKLARAFPGMQTFFREAELKHGRIAMLAALGYPLAEKFHPFFGGADFSADGLSFDAFQVTPLETFWPIVVGAIFILEAASAIPTFKAADAGQWFQIKEDHVAGDLGFDPLGLADEGDVQRYREGELLNGRIAMLAIAGMVAQEANNGLPIIH